MHRSHVQDGQADPLSCSMSACRRKARPLGRPGFFVDTSSLFRLSLRFVASWAGRRVGFRQRTHNPPPKGRRGFEPHPAHQGFQRLLGADLSLQNPTVPELLSSGRPDFFPFVFPFLPCYQVPAGAARPGTMTGVGHPALEAREPRLSLRSADLAKE